MTTSALVTDKLIETYLNRLNAAALTGTAPAEKAEILREIQAHILDATEHAADRDGAVDRVLRLLGTPEELAERYGTECLFTRSSSSFSPWLLLRTSWRWAKLGIKGTLTFFLALFGYTTALSLTVAVFLKPFMPSKIGMWIGPEGLNIGSEPSRADARIAGPLVYPGNRGRGVSIRNRHHARVTLDRPETYSRYRLPSNPHVLIREDLIHAAAGRCFHLRHTLRRISCLHAIPWSSRLLRSILRRALRLQCLRVKHTVVIEAPIGERLGVVFERVGWSFGSGVIDVERLILFHQHELHVSSRAFDRARLYIPGDAQALRVRTVAHPVEFLDGDVVALAVLYAGVGEVAQQQDDNRCRSAKFEISLGLIRHRVAPETIHLIQTLRVTARRSKIREGQVVAQFELYISEASSRRARVSTSGPRDLPWHTAS